MFDNVSYKNNLKDAVSENNILANADKQNWFYKKWPRLLECPGGDEFFVEQKMNGIKKRYRNMYEQSGSIYPTAQPFNRIKNDIERCKLFQVFRTMPKLSLLHVHNAAALSLDGLMQLIKKWEGNVIYIAYNEKNGVNRKVGTLFYGMPGLQSAGVMQVKEYLQSPDNERQLRDWLSFESAETTEHLTYRWDKFNEIFPRTGELFDDKSFYYEYHKCFFLECLKDKIYYVELRCSFQNFSASLFEEKTNLVFGYSTEFLFILNDAANDANTQYRRECAQQAGGMEPQPVFNSFKLKVILCARRDLNPEIAEQREKLMKRLDAAILWKAMNIVKKDFIIGFDFVSEEDRGKNTYSYYKDILYAKTLTDYILTEENTAEIERLTREHEQLILNIKSEERIKLITMYLHAGESLWMEQDNIIDAMVSCSTRIGHGFQMAVYPGIIEKYQHTDSLGTVGPILEICPISNQLLGYFPDLRNHTALALMKQGVPCVLANDDPQILGNPGLSYDFWEMYMASNGSLSMIKGIVFLGFLFLYATHQNTDIHNQQNIMQFDQIIDSFHSTYWVPFLGAARDILR